MILNMQEIRGAQSTQQYEYSFEQQFHNKIYALNNRIVSQLSDQKKNQYQTSGQQDLIKILKQRKKNYSPNNQSVKVKVNMGMNVYQDYVNFIPIRDRCYKDRSQWQKQFAFLSQLSNNELRSRQYEFQNDIKKHLKNGLRQKLCEKYDPTFNFIDKIKLYMQLLAKGTKVIKDFKDQHRILYFLAQCEYYLQVNNSFIKNVSVSLLTKQKLSLQAISYTMKGLYCPVCLIYDCPIHQKHELMLGENQNALFVSPRNKKQKSDHVKAFIKMVNYDKVSQSQRQKCCQNCYLSINKMEKDDKFNKQLANAHTSMSDLKKIIIQLGVYVFSFNPCLISKLFPKKQTPCSLIYRYLESQYNHEERINIKMQKDEIQMLRNESTYEKVQIPKNLLKLSKNRFNPHKIKGNLNGYDYDDISICFHHFLNKPSVDQSCKNCLCQKRGYCLNSCLCSSQCPLMKKGCRCKKSGQCCSTNNCPCYKKRQECIPDLCGKNCSKDQMCCMNQQIQKRKIKKLKIGISKIKGAGLGLFTLQKISKDQLITRYLSQKIDSFTLEIRDILRTNNSFYNFDLNGLTLDSKFIGNKSRFINHGQSKMINTEVRIIKSMGQKWIAFFATRDIEPEEQLFFDYDGDGQLAKHHSDKYPFIVPK